MRTMPRVLLLLFCMSVVTMMFIARCGLNMDSQFHGGPHSGLPVSSSGTPGEKALREVMRRKEVEHSRDKTLLHEKIKSLETELAKVQGQVVNLTTNLQVAEKTLGRYQSNLVGNQNIDPGDPNGIPAHHRSFGNPDQNQFLSDNEYRQRNDHQNDPNRNRLKYQNDGLNPVPRFHPQSDKWPVFVPPEDRRPVFQLGENKVRDPAFGQGQGLDPRQDVMQERRLSQVVGDSQKYLNGYRNSIDQKIDVGHIKRDTDNYIGRGMNQAGNDMMNMADRDEAAGGGVYPVPTGGNIRFGRSAGEAGERYDGRQQPDQLEIERQDENERNVGNGSWAIDYGSYFQERLELTEVLKGQSYKTEYELIPFNRFIFNRIFMVEPGLGKRVVEKPIGAKKKDLNEILYHAVETLNKNRSENNLYTYDDFVEGIYRSDPAAGSHYELFFYNKDNKTSKNPGSYVKLSVFRPFAPPMTVQQHVVDTGSEWINIILPLSKRIDTFRIFMDQFVTVCIKHDKRIYLTVVYFGTEGLKEVKSIMGHVAKVHKFKHMKLVTLNETFARGRGLQIGALNWKGGGDVLLFFCDVDIVFMPDFLERCRLNSGKGQTVYYPIVFSLYNPKIVYSLQDLPIPSLQDQLVLSKDSGFWRDFGYGMTCLYRSDFLKIKGFDEQITGWGGEDVFLYQKFVRSDYFVVRATDPAIFHLWHEKVCDPTLSAEQYRSCIRSKALNEASHAQLGLLAFKDEIDVHRGVSERNSILMRNALAEGKDGINISNGSEAQYKKSPQG